MSDKDKLDRLISACNFMLDVLDLVQFRDAAGLRLYHTHPAYERLQQTLDEVTK